MLLAPDGGKSKTVMPASSGPSRADPTVSTLLRENLVQVGAIALAATPGRPVAFPGPFWPPRTSRVAVLRTANLAVRTLARLVAGEGAQSEIVSRKLCGDGGRGGSRSNERSCWSWSSSNAAWCCGKWKVDCCSSFGESNTEYDENPPADDDVDSAGEGGGGEERPDALELVLAGGSGAGRRGAAIIVAEGAWS